MKRFNWVKVTDCNGQMSYSEYGKCPKYTKNGKNEKLLHSVYIFFTFRYFTMNMNGVDISTLSKRKTASYIVLYLYVLLFSKLFKNMISFVITVQTIE